MAGTDVTDFALIFLAGLAGSMHCVGMCGGFACGLGTDSRGHAATAWRHLAYNVGRVTSYAFLGAVVGHLGVLLVGHEDEASTGSLAQRALALVSGALMIYIGLQFLGLLGRKGHPLLGLGAQGLTQSLRALLKAPGLGAPLAFGVLNGLLPCPLVYALAAQAAASGSAASGLGIMVVFGLGTFPAMLAMGGIGWWWQHKPRMTAPRPTGTSVDPPRGYGPAWERPGARPAEMTTPRPAEMIAAGFVPRPALPVTWHSRAAARLDWRAHGVRLAGVFIVVLGLITFARGVLPMGAHLH